MALSASTWSTVMSCWYWAMGLREPCQWFLAQIRASCAWVLPKDFMCQRAPMA